MASGTLFIVSTPIGHDDDITLRALKVLNTCDVVVCEEMKEGATLLRKHKLSKPLEEFNEHSDDSRIVEIVSWLQEGKNIALISDCGTPIVADPGLGLLNACLKRQIPITVVPGVSSIMVALTRSGFRADTFVSAGFLGRKPEERRVQIKQLAKETRTVVLLETPYRLKTILGALAEEMPERKAYLGCNLTYPSETHHYGTLSELLEKFTENKFRGEFVIVFEGFSGVLNDDTDDAEDESQNKKTRKKSSKKAQEVIFDREDEEDVFDGNEDDAEYDENETYDDDDEDGDDSEETDYEDLDAEEEEKNEESDSDRRFNSDRRYQNRNSYGRPQNRYDNNRRSYGDRDGRRSGDRDNRRVGDRDNRRVGDRDNRQGNRANSGGGRRDFNNDRWNSNESRQERRDRYKSRFNSDRQEQPPQRKTHGNREGANIPTQNPYEGRRPFRPRFDRDDRNNNRGQFSRNNESSFTNPNRKYRDEKEKDTKKKDSKFRRR